MKRTEWDGTHLGGRPSGWVGGRKVTGGQLEDANSLCIPRLPAQHGSWSSGTHTTLGIYWDRSMASGAISLGRGLYPTRGSLRFLLCPAPHQDSYGANA